MGLWDEIRGRALQYYILAAKCYFRFLKLGFPDNIEAKSNPAGGEKIKLTLKEEGNRMC